MLSPRGTGGGVSCDEPAGGWKQGKVLTDPQLLGLALSNLDWAGQGEAGEAQSREDLGEVHGG
jgi:hypothetical protein